MQSNLPNDKQHASRAQNGSNSQWLWVTVIGAVGVVALIITIVSVAATRKNDTSHSSPGSYSQQNPTSGTSGTYSGNGTTSQTQSHGQAQPPTEGVITELSNTSISVKATQNSQIKTFTVNSNTKIMKSGNASGFTTKDLKVGQKVTVAPAPGSGSVAEMIALDNQGLLHDVPQ